MKGKGFQGAVLRAMRVEEHTATVTTTWKITDHVIGVGFHSDTLLGAEGEAPAAWVRFWFPDPDGGVKLYQRGYTFLEANPSTGDFSVAFVLHHPRGPAATWAATATPGDTLSVQRFGSSGFHSTDVSNVLLVGDAASWPAISSIIAALPQESTIEVVMEQFHEDDTTLPFPTHPNLRLRWVPTRENSRALVDALHGQDFHGWYCWVAAESVATRLVKTHLSVHYDHNRATLHAQAYWIHGRAMGTSRDADEGPQQREETTPTAGGNTAPASTGPPADAAVESSAPPPSVLRPARVAMILSAVVQALLSISFLVPYVLFAQLALRLMAGAGVDELLRLGIIALVVLGVNTTGTAALLFALHVYDARFSLGLRQRVLRKLAVVPLGWFKDRRSADVKTLVQDNVSALHYVITHAVPDLVGAVVTPLAIVIYLFTVNWHLGVVLLVPVAVFLFVTIRQARKDKEKITAVLQWNATIGGDVERFVSGQAVSRIFGDNATVNLPENLRSMHRFLITWQRGTLGPKLNAEELTRPLTLVVLLSVAGVLLVSSGVMPAPHLIPFLILGPSFGERLLAISYAANGLREGFNAKNNLELALTTPELASTAPTATDHARVGGTATGGLKVVDVSFTYSTGTRALSGINLEIPAGSTTALVGPSGSGKSTFAALLGRLWDPDTGSILLDGVDLRAIPTQELHRSIAIVLQDVQLIKGSIFDNIALGHAGATRDQVRAAARAAHIDEVIMALPDGYDTRVNRTSLSGGQRQRVAIARALLGDPAVVVLDEATAAADPHSEWAVRQGLRALLAGRTTIIVAHRLHTITGADRIVVFDRGRIAQQGTHQELMSTGGLYGQLVAASQPDQEDRDAH